MANYYTDHPEIGFHLNHPLMRRVAELKERGYSEKERYEEAPVDYEDCIENYRRLLEIAGDIAANTIAPNSEDVDLEGPHLENGRMKYASKTVENMEAVRLAGLWGVTMPRRYGGLNAPETIFSMASEVISAADSSFQNIWSLQSCAETLYEFGSEEQRQKFIPRICAGETMSMDLTEPDAGSDLQSVMLKATWSEEQGCWLLNGVKRFITNGDSDIHLVLARSEEGTRDGRGLSAAVNLSAHHPGVKVQNLLPVRHRRHLPFPAFLHEPSPFQRKRAARPVVPFRYAHYRGWGWTGADKKNFSVCDASVTQGMLNCARKQKQAASAADKVKENDYGKAE